MLELLWLVPGFPLAGFAALALFGHRWARGAIASVGVGSVALSAVVAATVTWRYVGDFAGEPYRQTLWTWMRVGGFSPSIGFYLDQLTVVMMLVVTGVGFLIHLYSAEFMRGEEGYSRFFAYLNLFVAAMLVVVMADNMLFLYLGWEGVGLCSYLLIGFWYRDESNGRAARKAFIVTRVGDTLLAVGLFYLFWQLGTLDIAALGTRAVATWAPGDGAVAVAALLLLGGAVGKSAQLPLQVWLPDAMAGPTPVSALIHAATMVTAGVYLIARTHALFALAPGVETTVAVIGALTLLLASCSALVQSDIKRILAYSTISQIGYMFLALGVGAWPAAIFHFMTHAFFKALLFLSAGVVILAMDHEHDIHKMGGLHREMPLAFWSFLIGAASLSALPLVTAGFYSKDFILSSVWASPQGGVWLWAAGWVGAFLTAVYSFRAVFIVFFGESRRPVQYRPGARIGVALSALSVLALVGGLVQSPQLPFGNTLFTGFLSHSLPSVSEVPPESTELILEFLAIGASLAGVAVAYLLFWRRPAWSARWAATDTAAAVMSFWRVGWGFDRIYDLLWVRPFYAVARALRADPPDLGYAWLAALSRAGHRRLSVSENGRVRWYAAGMAMGLVVLIAVGLIA